MKKIISQVPPNTFDEKTLKNVIKAALLMSSIDGEVHQKEWEVIQAFADHFWKEDYEDFSNFRTIIEKDLDNLLKETDTFQSSLIELVGQLTMNLYTEQKNIVLNLVGDVMVADGIMTLEESKLFATFMDKLGIRIG